MLCVNQSLLQVKCLIMWDEEGEGRKKEMWRGREERKKGGDEGERERKEGGKKGGQISR